MSKHTPGPWNTQRNVVNYRSGRKALEIRGASDELIATLPGCDRDTANASMIAAVPDLLTKAKELLAALDRDLPHNMKHHAAGERFNLRAVIAKAEAADG